MADQPGDTDDLEKLRRAMKAAPLTPDPDRKTATLRAAQLAFEKEFSHVHQAEPDLTRQTIERPHWVARLIGGLTMYIPSTRSVLAGGASLGVLALALVILQDPARYAPTPDLIEIGQTDAETPQIEDRISQATDSGTSTRSRRVAENPVPEALIEAAPAAPNPAEARKTAPAAELDAFSTRGLPIVPQDDVAPPRLDSGRDRFEAKAENRLTVTTETPVSTFSVDVDTASYTWARKMIEQGNLPDPDAVRVEEFINYFSYAYPAPETPETPFQSTVSVIDTPWNAGTKLMQIGIRGYNLPLDARPDVNLVFLVDVSGSMNAPDKLPLLINALRLLVGELRDSDTVSIVTYAGRAGTVLEPTSISDKSEIFAALDRLQLGGGTAGQAGIEAAYRLAERVAEDGETTRIILATDGDFNIGQSDDASLTRLIEDKRDSGIFLSVFGFGQGNYNDALMQRLAQNGNGQAAYIDSLSEARKVLVENTGGALFPIAKDVKIQVEFNPAQIAEYRLIGYETRALNREDFNNDAVDAGEIGAGHTVTAIYEITPVDSPARLTEPLRYPQTATDTETSDEIAFLRLRYKEPEGELSKLIETPVRLDTKGTPAEATFAAAVAGYASLLRGSDYMGDWTFADAAALARANLGDDPFGHRAEFIGLVNLAESLAKSR